MATGFFGAIKGALFETDPEQAPSGEKTTPPAEIENGAVAVISDAAAPDVIVKGLTDAPNPSTADLHFSHIGPDVAKAILSNATTHIELRHKN
jgi:hypothetical protein